MLMPRKPIAAIRNGVAQGILNLKLSVEEETEGLPSKSWMYHNSKKRASGW